MGKVVLYVTTSLDGFLYGLNDDVSWLEPFKEIERADTEFFSSVGAALEGVKTYNILLKRGLQHDFPTLVMTREIPPESPQNPPNVEFTKEDITEVLNKAKQKAGDKNIWVAGGANIAQQLISLGLLDEIHLTLVPIFVGDGTRLFANVHPGTLTLQSIKQADKGAAYLVYTVNRT